MMETIDLFSGSGGFSLGFGRAGFKVAGAYENWRPALETYKRNFRHSVFEMDLGDVEASVAHIRANFSPELIIGGPPCQDFSIANNKKSTERANLTIQFARIVAQTRPRVFVMENVCNIERSQFLSDALKIFSDAGYGLTSRVIEACRVGVPQLRRRYFLVGALNFQDDAFGFELDRDLSSKRTTVRDCLGSDVSFEFYYAHPRSYQRRAIFSVDEPAATIRRVNRPVPPNYQLHKADKAVVTEDLRALTTAERSQLQTFPRDFQFIGSVSQVEQQIGNAVPVLMAEYVANSILRTLQACDSADTLRRRDHEFQHELHLE